MMGSPRPLPASHYKNLSEIENTYWWHVSRVLWVERMIKYFAPDASLLDVVDFGCGTGGFLHKLNDRMKFRSILGVDVSSEAISYAGRNSDAYRCIEPGDFTAVTGKHFIFLMDVLEHQEDDCRFMTSLITAMPKGSRILLSVPAGPALFSDWDRALGHYRRYTKQTLSAVIRKAGGTVLVLQHAFAFLVPVAYWQRVAFRRQANNSSDFPEVSPVMNKLLIGLNRLEISISNRIKFPGGITIISVITKE